MNSKKSTRHHYIPKFLINGFTDDRGMVYVYDKMRDILHDKGRSPKSVFFEKNRNTIELPNKDETSLLEDEFYSKLDNDSALAIKYFKETLKDSFSIDEEHVSKFEFFLINLFWRIPSLDFAVQDILERAQTNPLNKNAIPLLSEDWFGKLQRFELVKRTIDVIAQNLSEQRIIEILLHDFSNHSFVLGDFPTVYECIPKSFNDFLNMEYAFAVSLRRIITKTKRTEKWTEQKNMSFNACIIAQSKRYVVSGDKQLLAKSIAEYNRLSEKLPPILLNKLLFSSLQVT